MIPKVWIIDMAGQFCPDRFPTHSTSRHQRKNDCHRLRFSDLVETLIFQQILNHLGSEGTVPVLPSRPCAFASVLYYLLWNYRSRGDATAPGAKALRAVAPKSVEKNSVISTEPSFSECFVPAPAS